MVYRKVIMRPKEAIKRLLIDVSPIEHAAVKSRAALIGISVRDYVRRAVIEQMKKDIDRDRKSEEEIRSRTLQETL